MSKIKLIKGKYSKIQIERQCDNGTFYICGYRFDQERHFKEASRILKLEVEQIKFYVNQFDGEEKEYEVEEEERERCFIRGRLLSATEAIGPFTFDEALGLQVSVSEPIIYWSGTDTLACLDIDFHGLAYDKRPTEHELLRLADQCTPRAAYVWATHGRGLHLIFRKDSVYSANELAAIAGLSLHALSSNLTVEVKSSSRHPRIPIDGRACGEVRKQEQSKDYSAISAWLGQKQVDEEEIEQWLIEHGLTKGQRYEHERCPVEPAHPSSRTPVCVFDGGIYCHTCNARGVYRGSRIAGWFSFASLIGGNLHNNLRSCIDNYTHWEHARHVIEETTGLRGEFARAAYSAAIKCRHQGTERVSQVFTAGTNLLRFNRYWGTLRGESYKGDISPILARLPRCLYEADGELHINTEIVARFNQPIDIAEYGYTPLRPIFGARIYSHYLPITDTNSIPIVLQSGVLASESMREFRAKYVCVANRQSEEDAWKVIEKVFPGVNRELIKLLIVAKGAAEGKIGLPPIIYISGPTSAAKTGSVLLAAAICGDNNTSVIFQANIERVRQSLLDAKECGSYVTFNEILKEGKSHGKSFLSTFHFLLNLTPDSVSHKLYTGPVPLSDLPVVILTDTTIPVELKLDAQLARRIVHVQLAKRVDWQSSLRLYGISDIRGFRYANPEYATAANTILSCCIDEFFQSISLFEEAANRLGFYRLAQSSEAQEGEQNLCLFFDAVCNASSIEGVDAKRWTGRGWKLIHRDKPSELQEIWLALCDEGFVTSERCNEAPWSQILDLPHSIIFEAKNHGSSKVAVRFIARVNRKDYLVNEELIHGKSTTTPESASLHRPGDTECGGSDHSWTNTLPI